MNRIEEYTTYLLLQKEIFNLSDGWYQLSRISDLNYQLFLEEFNSNEKLRKDIIRKTREKKIKLIVG